MKTMPEQIKLLSIRTELLRRFSEPLTGAQRNDSAIPSYLHWNPFVRWIITKRLEVIVSFIADILSSVDSQPLPSALDVGCGVGILIPSLSRHLSTFYVTDHVMDGARLTAKYFGAENVKFLEPEKWAIDISDRSLKIVIAADVLEHVEDLEGMVSSINRKLSPRGSLIVSGPTETFIYDLARKMAGFSGEYHVRTIFDIEGVIAEKGFRVVARKQLPLPILPKLFRVTHYRKEGHAINGDSRKD